jgi:predicted DNA-binding protein
MSKQIVITVSDGIYEILEKAANQLGKKVSALARELMEQKLNEMSLVSERIKGKRR